MRNSSGKVAACGLIAGLAVALAGGGSPEVLRADPLREEFLEVAERIEASANPYLGRRQIADLNARLRAADETENPARVAALHGQLSFEHLRLGDLASGVRHMEKVFSMAEERGLQPTILMQRLRVMVELRRAEVKNCIERHNRDCCIFPLAGGGVHDERDPAQRARGALDAILAERPGLEDAQWLLNIVAMAAGEYPKGVPERFRLPPEALESEVEVDRFVDVAPGLGLDALNLCGGVAVEDFDGDGLLDIATSTSDPRGHLLLYRNRGDGSFDEISEAAGLRAQLGGLNCVAADYDGDGDVDLLVLRGGWMGAQGRVRNSLLRNDGPGDGAPVSFTDVTRAAGFAEPAYPTQAAVWGDFDNDGDLDLFVGNESAGADPSAEVYPSQLFRNEGGDRFTDIAVEAGVTNGRLAKGVGAGDFDNDGDLDLYVSNIGANRLYRNDTPHGEGGEMRFTDLAPELGVSAPKGRSFATWFFDYNNDGWLDLFVVAYDATAANLMRDYRGLPHGCTAPCLYLNRGGKFEEVAGRVGLDHAYLPMGASFGDIDNDGFLDIYLATGDPAYETLMPNVMLRNASGKRFQDVTTAGGFGHLQKGHGIGFADLDHDGDQDLYHQLGGFFPGDRFHNALFLNPGNENRWLSLELRGTESNRAAVGARVKVTVRSGDDRREIHRAAGCVSSFGGSPTGRLEIGLGAATAIESLEVSWPGSVKCSVFEDVPLDRALRVVQGEATLEVLERRRIRLKGAP